MTRFDRLLADLAEDPTNSHEIKKSWHPGKDNYVKSFRTEETEAERRKEGAREFLRSWWDNHARVMAQWARIKATPPLAPMIKALKAETEEMLKANRQFDQANQFHAARERLEDFNRRFTAEVESGALSAGEAAQIEARLNHHASALGNLGRKLGIA
jgi:hypothetical protein